MAKINETPLMDDLKAAARALELDLGDIPNLKAAVGNVERYLQLKKKLIASLRPAKDKVQGSGIRRTWETEDGKTVADVKDDVLLVARAKSATLALLSFAKAGGKKDG